MIEKLLARRAELIEIFTSAQRSMEQARGALALIDELIKELTNGNVGETVSHPEPDVPA